MNIDTRIQQYIDQLEENITHHIAAGKMPLRDAFNFYDQLKYFMFGGPKSLGFVHFAMQNDKSLRSPEQVLVRGEDYFRQGWRLVDGQLYNPQFQQVANLTIQNGQQQEEVPFSKQSLYQFLPDQVIKSLLSLIKQNGLDPMMMGEPSLIKDFVLKNFGDNNKLYKYTAAYFSLSLIFAKITLTEDVFEDHVEKKRLDELFQSGFRLLPYTDDGVSQKSILLEKGDTHLLVSGVVNTTMLDKVNLISQLELQSAGISTGEVGLLFELDKIYALFQEVDLEQEDAGELITYLSQLEGKTREKIAQAVINLYVLAYLLDFNVMDSLNFIDSVKGKVRMVVPDESRFSAVELDLSAYHYEERLLSETIGQFVSGEMDSASFLGTAIIESTDGFLDQFTSVNTQNLLNPEFKTQFEARLQKAREVRGRNGLD